MLTFPHPHRLGSIGGTFTAPPRPAPAKLIGGIFTPPPGAIGLPMLTPCPPFGGLGGMLIPPPGTGCGGGGGGAPPPGNGPSVLWKLSVSSEEYEELDLARAVPARRNRRKRRYVSRAKNKMSSTTTMATTSLGLAITTISLATKMSLACFSRLSGLGDCGLMVRYWGCDMLRFSGLNDG